MQDKESVTIVIPAHNNAKTIMRAVESVTKGNRPADQVIVGDNDSTDGTYDVLCKALGAESVTIEGKTGLPPQFDGKINNIPIKIFRKRLSTIGHTLNTAMQMKWTGVTIFGFMDPLSWYAPDKISQAIFAFNCHPQIACVISDCDNHHQDGMVERVFRCSFDMKRLLTDFQYDRNFLVRSQIFPKMKSGFNEDVKTRDDYDLLLRISEIGLIYHIPAPLHHNTIIEVEEKDKMLITQAENTIRQLTSQRRGG